MKGFNLSTSGLGTSVGGAPTGTPGSGIKNVAVLTLFYVPNYTLLCIQNIGINNVLFPT
jgi:hypothetical protein